MTRTSKVASHCRIFGKLAALSLSILATASGLQAQARKPQRTQQAEDRPSRLQFEITSVRPRLSGSNIAVMSYPGGKVVGSYCTLELLLTSAFDVQAFQISGGPKWIQTDRFDVVGLPPPSPQLSKIDPPSPYFPLTPEQREMLQGLIINRFNAHIHWETKVGDVFVLSKGPKPLKIRKTESANPRMHPWVGSPSGGVIRGDGIAGEKISMGLLAQRLGRYLLRPVIDQTGIDGDFDFEYRYAAEEDNVDVVGSIFTSLNEIGLVLRSGKGPVETLVIDSVDKPVPN